MIVPANLANLKEQKTPQPRGCIHFHTSIPSQRASFSFQVPESGQFTPCAGQLLFCAAPQRGHVLQAVKIRGRMTCGTRDREWKMRELYWLWSLSLIFGGLGRVPFLMDNKGVQDLLFCKTCSARAISLCCSSSFNWLYAVIMNKTPDSEALTPFLVAHDKKT